MIQTAREGLQWGCEAQRRRWVGPRRTEITLCLSTVKRENKTLTATAGKPAAQAPSTIVYYSVRMNISANSAVATLWYSMALSANCRALKRCASCSCSQLQRPGMPHAQQPRLSRCKTLAMASPSKKIWWRKCHGQKGANTKEKRNSIPIGSSQSSYYKCDLRYCYKILNVAGTKVFNVKAFVPWPTDLWHGFVAIPWIMLLR